MTVSPPVNVANASFLDSVEGEISFFRSIMRARPVGIHRHFHALAIQNYIFKDTGRFVAVDDIWEKLKTCYNLDQLEAIDLEAENYDSPNTKHSPVSIPSPSPTQNLSGHPFFREEFTLPYEDFEAIIAQRRLRDTVSAPSSPAPPPPPPARKKGATRRRGKSNLNLAGLVGGDSDSSALTQESGDEPLAETPRESVVTGTDAGTDYAEEEDVEMREPSPGKMQPFGNSSLTN
ncbi:hypothetical protein AMATHDRAFT_45103 [Amanita thiersii Skay4041]|uniref:Chromatin modification-related protein EAF7 n=1 Tax=Amanita thiersii Skay4041 TaxID=703135 RepID=A0A2A9NU66_9AGAR|nr:hypothetical protein AMATHDRAFT_45103 [Amanita thiersii Skay4041]